MNFPNNQKNSSVHGGRGGRGRSEGGRGREREHHASSLTARGFTTFVDTSYMRGHNVPQPTGTWFNDNPNVATGGPTHASEAYSWHSNIPSSNTATSSQQDWQHASNSEFDSQNQPYNGPSQHQQQQTQNSALLTGQVEADRSQTQQPLFQEASSGDWNTEIQECWSGTVDLDPGIGPSKPTVWPTRDEDVLCTFCGGSDHFDDDCPRREDAAKEEREARELLEAEQDFMAQEEELAFGDSPSISHQIQRDEFLSGNAPNQSGSSDGTKTAALLNKGKGKEVLYESVLPTAANDNPRNVRELETWWPKGDTVTNIGTQDPSRHPSGAPRLNLPPQAPADGSIPKGHPKLDQDNREKQNEAHSKADSDDLIDLEESAERVPYKEPKKKRQTGVETIRIQGTSLLDTNGDSHNEYLLKPVQPQNRPKEIPTLNPAAQAFQPRLTPSSSQETPQQSVLSVAPITTQAIRKIPATHPESTPQSPALPNPAPSTQQPEAGVTAAASSAIPTSLTPSQIRALHANLSKTHTALKKSGKSNEEIEKELGELAHRLSGTDADHTRQIQRLIIDLRNEVGDCEGLILHMRKLMEYLLKKSQRRDED